MKPVPIEAEVPRRTVVREAAFYSLFAKPFGGLISFEKTEKKPYFPPNKPLYPEWWPLNEETFPSQELPELMREHWQHRIMTLDVQKYAHLLWDLRITNDYMIPYLPDIISCYPLVLVSDKGRDALEKIDADALYFLPVRLLDESNELITQRYHQCFFRHRIRFKAKTYDHPKRYHLPFLPYGPVRENQMAWEMQTRPDVRAYLKEIPFWGAGSLSECCFSGAAFKQLKAAGVTGLIESTVTDPFGELEPFENVGHIE